VRPLGGKNPLAKKQMCRQNVLKRNILVTFQGMPHGLPDGVPKALHAVGCP
jgi:hypothetical protein